MNLRLIPIEEEKTASSKKQKFFNPGNKIKKCRGKKCRHLKDICLKLIHFINRGERFSFDQIDDLIISMQHSILNLQKKKQEILKNKNRQFGFQKRKIR